MPVHCCRWFAWIILFPLVAGAAGTEVDNGQAILAQSARVTLTRADYEAELARRVPEAHRSEFASSPQRITAILNAALVRKTLAAEARAAGLDREPPPLATGADEDGILAARFIAKLDADARADFDRRIEGFTAKARENYLVTRQAYVTKEQIELSHIFVEAEKRGDDAALRLAGKARAELLAGAEFATAAQQYSDDRASASAGGRAGWFSRDEIDPALAETLFAMKEIGAISEPIRTRSGYNVFRLDGRRPPRQQTFDEVKDVLLAQLRQAHLDALRAAKDEAIIADPGLRVNRPALDALAPAIDPEAVRRALQTVLPNPAPK